MVPKRLLCISPDDLATVDVLRADMPDWQIHAVRSFDEARSALRQDTYLVGLLMQVIGSRPHLEVERFLRQHGHVQWVGVAKPDTLAAPAWRALAARDCRVEAWLRFARAPSLADGSATDLRFGIPGAPNFSTLALGPGTASPCPSGLPRWGHPRADLLHLH